MSRTTLEKVLELLINEEREAAEELLHDFIVENARQIHEELLRESDEVVEEDLEDLDESDEEMLDGLESDDSEIDTEEFYDEDELEDEEAVDDLEMGDDMGDDNIEGRVDDIEAALADLEAEFERIMAGEEEEGHDFGDEDEVGGDEGEDFGGDIEADFGDEDEDEVEESFDLDLDESEDEDLVEYVTAVSAKPGDNGVNTKSPTLVNPKRPGDDSNAKPIRTNDGNTSGGKGETPKAISTGNVNVSGNGKSPAWKGQTAKPGDDGVNKKSLL
jgi:hypothetical protein